MDVIDIGKVLGKYDDTYDEMTNSVNQYHIRFITADGRVRTMLSRKNVKSPSRKLQGALQPRGKQTFNLKKHATMLMHDLSIDEPRFVKIPMIFNFKNQNNWNIVRH